MKRPEPPAKDARKMNDSCSIQGRDTRRVIWMGTDIRRALQREELCSSIILVWAHLAVVNVTRGNSPEHAGDGLLQKVLGVNDCVNISIKRMLPNEW